MGTAEAERDQLDVHAVRRHFAFGDLGRVVTNNAASTQPPRELLALYDSLAPGYENVHRGQSSASQEMTALFEDSYDTIAQFIGAPGRVLGQPEERPWCLSCCRELDPGRCDMIRFGG